MTVEPLRKPTPQTPTARLAAARDEYLRVRRETVGNVLEMGDEFAARLVDLAESFELPPGCGDMTIESARLKAALARWKKAMEVR